MLTRIITAIVLLAVVVAALFLDPTGWAVRILVILIAFTSAYELGRILKLGASTAGAVTVLFFAVSKTLPVIHPLAWLLISIIGVGLYALSTRAKSDFWKFGFSAFWIGGTLIPFYILAATKSPGYWPLIMTAAIPIWCGDTAAIFVGKAFGKHKMAPDISPKKTWEGAAGNFLACVAAAMVLGAIFHYPLLAMALLGLNCGVLGQAGDLFESWLKRKADMKDSGNILPGHGGVLDRIDSLMATAPISLMILQLMVPAISK